MNDFAGRFPNCQMCRAVRSRSRLALTQSRERPPRSLAREKTEFTCTFKPLCSLKLEIVGLNDEQLKEVLVYVGDKQMCVKV